MSRRTLKVADLLRDELSILLQRRAKDPRLHHLVSITSVAISSDLKQAKVFVSIMGTDNEKDEVIKGLKSATPFFRRSLGGRLSLRYVPNLVFLRDDSLEKGAKVLELMDKVTSSERESRTHL